MSSGDQWTIGRLLAWTADYLKRQGSETPRLDAEVLLAHALDVQRIDLYMRIDSEPDESRRKAFRELVKRRAAHEPVAYLVGHKEFYSLDFQVTRDVLIPRPETELLVVAVSDLIRERRGTPAGAARRHEPSDGGPASQMPTPEMVRICDVGTGSGAVAVSLAKHVPACVVTAVDIRPEALAVAERNATAHGVSDRVELIQSDLLETLPPNRQFEYIASNPPYVTEAEMATLPADVREHEPWVALCGGPRGIEIIERLVPRAVQRLTPGGWLAIEIGPSIHSPVIECLRAEPGLECVSTIKDLAGLPRVVRARRVSG